MEQGWQKHFDDLKAQRDKSLEEAKKIQIITQRKRVVYFIEINYKSAWVALKGMESKFSSDCINEKLEKNKILYDQNEHFRFYANRFSGHLIGVSNPLKWYDQSIMFGGIREISQKKVEEELENFGLENI